MNRRILLAAAAALPFLAVGPAPAAAGSRACVDSPDTALRVCIAVDARGPSYQVVRNGREVIRRSALGLSLEGDGPAQVNRIERIERAYADQTWEQPWGEQRLVRDRHNEMRVRLAGPAGARPYEVVVRAFDDGFGFRYDVPAAGPVEVLDEATEFNFAGRYDAWWYPARERERDEYLYTRTDLDAVSLAETPFTLQGEGLYLSVHEAALVDYASMNLRRTGPGAFKADLMPWSDGVRVRRDGAFVTPWRVVLVGESAGALADSRLVLNLNEPNRLGDVSWVKPTKYVGVWWEMHLNRSTWGGGPTHGATTANVRRYIDFAAENGFGGVLAEGWNTGWDGDWIANGDKFSFTQAHPDFDLAGLADYARQRGVGLIGHHETGGAVENYERQLDAALDLYAGAGVRAVKTGYVKPNGTIVHPGPDGATQSEWFAGQYMVRHHQKVAEAAAARHISIDAHEPVKDTGLRRTWPNLVSREGARGQEFNAWGRPTNPPEHVTILPFTRLLAGPMDYTPGIFDLTFGKAKVEERVQSTLATQLALYVVIYSPVQMAADLPENYAARPDAFQFIRDVPVDWETSKTLAGEIGDYVVVARRQRGGADWFLGAVTDETARRVPVTLDFLEPGRRYEAQIYRDGPGADYVSNPYAFETARRVVTAHDRLELALAPGGGQAIRFRALD
ncbi:glycoside hydrolase family 97 protein [Caulobacter sp. 17J80-11]|uniref:glycoside hydrolase family 97 protein n=1 Tax=Caulobacter sp. 17J80-11 TaxID=2763502 RepID=UPI001653E61F|nr:glycoside hydrolase family 97 protein [Caulobacter sp. 17J80-11]MBC6983417.1 glycoside hydrolase family 97 protein [Caulobacter sp. 17J80-11]